MPASTPSRRGISTSPRWFRVGPRQEREAEKARTRLLSQVDEKRNPKTRATVDQLMKRYFAVLDVDTQTKGGYLSKYHSHIEPLLGSTLLTRLDVETLDTFYSELRRCRIHCQRRKKEIEHRTTLSLRGRTTASHLLSTSASSNTASPCEREIPHAYPSFGATSHAMHLDQPGSAHAWSADQVHQAPAF